MSNHIKKSAFLRAQGELTFNMRYIDLDLSVARDNVEIRGISGTYFFCPPEAFDSATVVSSTLTYGHCFVRVSRSTSDPVFITGGFEYDGDAFDKLFITNAAQANKMLRIYYSEGVALRPFASQTLTTVANPEDVRRVVEGSTFSSNHGLAGGITLVTAAANINGVVIKSGVMRGAAGTTWQLRTHTAVPAAWTEGNTLLTSDGDVAQIQYEIFIPVGRGIYLYRPAGAGTLTYGFSAEVL